MNYQQMNSTKVQTIDVQDFVVDRLELVAKLIRKRRRRKFLGPNTDMLKAVLAYNKTFN